MEDLKNMLNESIQSIERTTDIFYQQKNKQGYKELENTLALLTQTMNEIFTYKLEGHEVGIDENQLIQVLTEAMKAIEVKDTVLLSDILQYELKELFNKVLMSL